MKEFANLSDEEILGLNAERNAEGYSRPVSDMMEINRLKSEALLRKKQGIPRDTPIMINTFDTISINRESPEQITSRKIEEMDQGMAALEQLIESKISIVSDPHKRLLLRNPCTLYNANKTNLLRNYVHVENEARKRNIPVEAVALTPVDARYFSIMVVEKSRLNTQKALIATAPMRRALVVGENYDLSTPFHQLTVGHEMVHMMHHTKQKIQNTEAFVRFYGTGEKSNVIAGEEDDAYAVELEIMNLLMDDVLRNEFAQKHTLSPDILMNHPNLGFQNHELPVAKMMLSLAKGYFEGNGNALYGKYPEAYKKEVRRITVEGNCNVFEYGQPGVPHL